jgi:predicted dehydrogenase
LVGCGRWGVHILRDLRTLGCEVHVIGRSEATAARARDGGAATVVPELDGVGPVDGLVVATPTSTHAEVLERALPLGVPTFVEKPLCLDLGEAERLAALAPERLFVMDKWRYHPGVLALAAIANDGRLGRVLGLRTTRVGWGTSHDDVDAAWVLAPHDLSIAREVLGALPQPLAAVGDRDAYGRVVLNGLLDASGVWHALEVSACWPEHVRRVELHCEQGIAVLAGSLDGYVSIYRAPGEPDEERIPTPGELPLLAELRAFVEHLRGGPPPRSSAAEGSAVVATVARLRELAGLT